MDQRKELSLIVGCSDVRAHNDDVDKACYILMNYEGDTKITKNRLSNYFGFTPSLLKNYKNIRFIAIFMVLLIIRICFLLIFLSSLAFLA